MNDRQLPFFVCWHSDPPVHPSAGGHEVELLKIEIAGDHGRVDEWLGGLTEQRALRRAIEWTDPAGRRARARRRPSSAPRVVRCGSSGVTADRGDRSDPGGRRRAAGLSSRASRRPDDRRPDHLQAVEQRESLSPAARGARGDRRGRRADEPLPGHGQRRDDRGAWPPGSASPSDQLAFGTGSVAVLYQLLQAVCEPGDEVIYAWRSFEAYPIAVQLTGATGGAGAARSGRGA